MILPLNCGILQTNLKFLKIGELTKFDEETEIFEKETPSTFWKASLTKLNKIGGGNYAGASRPFQWISCWTGEQKQYKEWRGLGI